MTNDFDIENMITSKNIVLYNQIHLILQDLKFSDKYSFTSQAADNIINLISRYTKEVIEIRRKDKK